MIMWYIVFNLLAGFLVSLTRAQNVTCSSQTPALLAVGSSAIVACSIQLTDFPIQIFQWTFNDVPVGIVSIGPLGIVASKANESYYNRVSLSVLPENAVFPIPEITATLTISQLMADENGYVVALMHALSNDIGSSVPLSVVMGCSRSLPNNVVVEAISYSFGSTGRFACSNSGMVFYSNNTLLSSLGTTCNELSQWAGQDNLQCWSAPNVLLLSSYNFFTLVTTWTCAYRDVFPYGNTTLFYIGSTAYELPKNKEFTLNLMQRRRNAGLPISCQAVTPYTRRFNESGMSNSYNISADALYAPFQNSTATCIWLINQQGICNVLFYSNPASVVKAIQKTGSFNLTNQGSNNITVMNQVHIFQFKRNKVTNTDSGNYEVEVAFKSFQRARFVIRFNIIVAGLPSISQSCIWYLGETESCEVSIPPNLGSEFVALYKDEQLTSVEMPQLFTSPDDSRSFNFKRLEVSTTDAGTYILVVKQEGSSNNSYVSFDIFVLEYPFDSALVIGITFVVFIIIGLLIAFQIHRVRIRKAKKLKAQQQVAEAQDGKGSSNALRRHGSPPPASTAL